MTKELFIAEHERLVAEYMDEHPGCTEADAIDRTADKASTAVYERYADHADYLRKKQREDALMASAVRIDKAKEGGK